MNRPRSRTGTRRTRDRESPRQRWHRSTFCRRVGLHSQANVSQVTLTLRPPRGASCRTCRGQEQRCQSCQNGDADYDFDQRQPTTRTGAHLRCSLDRSHGLILTICGGSCCLSTQRPQTVMEVSAHSASFFAARRLRPFRRRPAAAGSDRAHTSQCGSSRSSCRSRSDRP